MNKSKQNKKVNVGNDKMDGIKDLEGKVSMLSAIEVILEQVEDSALSSECLDMIEPYCKYISDMQGITPEQALLLSLFVEGSLDGSSVSVSEIARYVDCPRVRIMRFQEDIDDLMKRKMLKKAKSRYGNEGLTYMVPADVISAIKYDRKYVPKSMVAKDGVQFLQMFFDLTQMRKEEEIDSEQLFEEFQKLLDENGELRYVKKLRKLNLSLASKLIVTHMARHLVLDQDGYITVNRIEYLFDNRAEAHFEINPLEDGSHVLMKKNLVEFDGEDGFTNNKRIKLTNFAKEKLLKEFKLPKNTETNVLAIKADSITKKELFFNDEIARQIENLSELLTMEKFTAVQTRLKEKGRRTGFACLFYGSPGTGKTESVMQLARETGRDIMLVDISDIKSKWVGESEQNIKAVFNNYRAMCKICERTPILLFNEADAILGTRMGKAIRAVDKMENSIQNIVLQEMETLDGIMIATTNLEQNLDKAFERRFIYKVRFGRPDAEQRANIWMAMLPSLDKDMAYQLATSYDFSGGQIDNIARKCDVDAVLYGHSSIDMDSILRFCREETITNSNTSRIGFV